MHLMTYMSLWQCQALQQSQVDLKGKDFTKKYLPPFDAAFWPYLIQHVKGAQCFEPIMVILTFFPKNLHVGEYMYIIHVSLLKMIYATIWAKQSI